MVCAKKYLYIYIDAHCDAGINVYATRQHDVGAECNVSFSAIAKAPNAAGSALGVYGANAGLKIAAAPGS